MRYLPYNKNLKEFSRELRRHSTKAEVLLWNVLKAGGMKGYKFNRQKPLGNYIADFYCKPLRLVIEIDGNSHVFDEVAAKDRKKQEFLNGLGISILRFTEKEVIFQRPQVIQAIYTMIENIEAEKIPHPLE